VRVTRCDAGLRTKILWNTVILSSNVCVSYVFLSCEVRARRTDPPPKESYQMSTHKIPKLGKWEILGSIGLSCKTGLIAKCSAYEKTTNADAQILVAKAIGL
jgi:hypothetical protein